MGEPASAFVEVNGARLYYEDSGNGETLVLIHAGIADSRMWEGQLAAFARCYRVIRYDMRGFGRSEMGEGPYAHHRDLHALLDALGVERAHLVGCSMGGRTAIDFTLEYPARVRSLVLVGSAIGGAEIWGDPRISGRSWSPQIMPETSGESPSWRSRSGPTVPPVARIGWTLACATSSGR